MKNIKEIFNRNIKGIFEAVFRFPLTSVSLLGAALITFRLIAVNDTNVLLQKLIFTFVVGAVLGVAAQFTVERFPKLSQKRFLAYGVTLLLIIGYFLILLPAPNISNEITVRSIVAVFALICIALWIPNYKSEVDFNLVTLIHFKGAATSLLYSAVLSAGLFAIIAAIDILLFKIDSDVYAYTMTIVWIIFAPIYYLSLLPNFNSEFEEDKSKVAHTSNYPKFLDILVSKIFIPLISAYTLVLIAYFVKILFTRVWPSGQIGPMVLVYSIVGLLIYVLSSLLENRFALFYRKVFPKILIPIVIMQLISVGIRLNSYGITESRYYIAIFSVFSIIIGFLLSFSPISKNGWIALLAAAFAVVSVIPPVDAFTVSRNSQINRIESIMEKEGILVNDKIIKKENVPEKTRIEITNILNYLERSSSLEYVKWLPEDFSIYEDLKNTMGFEPTYSSYIDEKRKYINISIDHREPLPISGYEVLLSASAGRYFDLKETSDVKFELDGKGYTLKASKVSQDEVYISIIDASGTEIIGTGLYNFAKELIDQNDASNEIFSAEKLSFEVVRGEFKMKIIFQNINGILGDSSDSGTDYVVYVLFGRD